ncbi:MAG: hypothetical protein ACLQQ4_05340 [Bacteroidia bacterium]
MIEPLNDNERKTIRDKSIVAIFFLNMNKKFGFIFLLFFAAFSLIIPFLPSRYGGHYNPPKDFTDYLTKLKIFWIVVPSFYIITCLLSFIRLKIDLSRSIKRVHTYNITHVLVFGIHRILVLNNSRLFSIRKGEPCFGSVTKWQDIQIKRTATFNLIEYSITDK